MSAGPATRMYAIDGIAYDPLVSEIDTVEELSDKVSTAQDVLGQLEEVDALFDAYSNHAARRGRMEGLRDHYHNDDYVAFFDQNGKRIDAFTIGDRYQQVVKQQSYLGRQLCESVDTLSNWDAVYTDTAEAVQNSIGFLYTLVKRGIGEEMIDPEIINEFRQEHPNDFYSVFSLIGSGHWNSTSNVLSNYIDAAGNLEEDGRYGTLEAFLTDGLDALEEAFQDRAEKESAFIHMLYENEADNVDESELSEPVPFRVQKLQMSSEELETYEKRAEGMFQ